MAEAFDIQIAKWVDKAKGRAREFCAEFIQDVNQAVVEATPVRTGFLRGSWYASIGAPAIGAGTVDPSGAASVAALNLVATEIVPGEVYYVMNGAKYAARVEYGFVGKDSLGRKYNQPPRAFVRGTVAKAEVFAEAAAARVAAQ